MTLTKEAPQGTAPRRRRRRLPKREMEARRARFPGGPEQVQAVVREAKRAGRRAERERVLALTQDERGGAAPAAGRPARGVHDVGVPLQIERGLVEVNKAALIPDDPDAKYGPSQRGARGQRVWVPDRLWRNKRIEMHHKLAAERFLGDYEVGREGARERVVAVVARDDGPRLPGPPARQLDALRRFREATERVGLISISVLYWCVLRVVPDDAAPTLEDFARRQSPAWPTDRATGLLIGALDALAAYYGTEEETRSQRGERRRHTIAGHAGHGPPPGYLPDV